MGAESKKRSKPSNSDEDQNCEGEANDLVMSKKSKTMSPFKSILPLTSYGEDDQSEESGEMKVENEAEWSDDKEIDFVKKQRQVEVRKDCPYLDTVNRQVFTLLFVSILGMTVFNCSSFFFWSHICNNIESYQLTGNWIGCFK